MSASPLMQLSLLLLLVSGHSNADDEIKQMKNSLKQLVSAQQEQANVLQQLVNNQQQQSNVQQEIFNKLSIVLKIKLLGSRCLSKISVQFAERDGRVFVKIQQRLSGRVSFQRNWVEYENGFGDETDFWVGLSTIHSLSINGATLRAEMKLWNETELHAEFSGFKVGDASTNYTMTYREMLKDRSSFSFDVLEYSKGMQFSTMDRDNDQSGGSCSNTEGKGGWWYNDCHYVNPNGLHGDRPDYRHAVWHTGYHYLPLREIRLMLQI